MSFTQGAASTGASNTQPAVRQPIPPEALAVYKKMLTYQFVGSLFFTLVLIFLLLLAYGTGVFEPAILPLVMLAGVLGAFVSALSRLYNFEALPEALVTQSPNVLKGWHLAMYAFVPAIVGAIGAVLLYLVFAGEMLQGSLFPTISCTGGAERCDSMAKLMNNLNPAAPKDYARAIVWGFIAGFSERFVPDTLQTFFAKKAEKKP